MSELRKSNTDATYFLTLTTVGWIDIFTRRLYADEIIESLQYCQQHKGMDIFAYVIMPSYIHLIARRTEGNLNDVIRDFKSFTAKRILTLVENNPQESRRDWLLFLYKYYAKKQKQNSLYQFWQKTTHPIELFTADVLQQKIDYIHHNPVDAGIVDEEQHYVYSSANPLSPLKVMEA